MSDVEERYAALQARAKAMGGELRITLHTGPVTAGTTTTILHAESADLTLDEAIASNERFIEDPLYAELVERGKRIDELGREHFVRGVELFTLQREQERAARERIDQAIAEETARDETPGEPVEAPGESVE